MARKPTIPFSVWAALGTVAGVSVATRLIQGKPVLRGSRTQLNLDLLLAEAQASEVLDLDCLLAQAQGAQQRRWRGEPGLLILSNGLGRDSATIIALLVAGKLKLGGRIVKPSDINVAVFSDPGNEWAFSVGEKGSARLVLDRMMDEAGVAHMTLEKPPAEIWEPWLASKRQLATKMIAQGKTGRDFTAAMRRWSRDNPQPWLQTDWQARAQVSGRTALEQKARGGGYHRRPPILAERQAMAWGTSMMGHACTIGHKIDPINALINDLTLVRWGVPLDAPEGQDSWTRRVQRGEAQPHRIIIGMAADETKRIERAVDPPWRASVFPLAAMGITKEQERPILAGTKISESALNLDFIKKSGCMLCHYQPVSYFYALRQTSPQSFAAIEAYERRANRKNSKYSIKNVIRVTTKRDALPLLVTAGLDADVQGWIVRGRRGEPQARLKRLSKALLRDEALDWLGRVNPQARKPVMIGELVNEWRAANPTAKLDEILDKTYERCGGMNLCSKHARDCQIG